MKITIEITKEEKREFIQQIDKDLSHYNTPDIVRQCLRHLINTRVHRDNLIHSALDNVVIKEI